MAYPPSQETMEQVFGPGAKVPEKWQPPLIAMGAVGDAMLQVSLGCSELELELFGALKSHGFFRKDDRFLFFFCWRCLCLFLVSVVFGSWPML